MASFEFNPFTGTLDIVSEEDLSGYVPYTGASANVDLGSYYLICGGSQSGQSTIASGLVVNDDGGNLAADDFRVESVGEANAFVVDASANQILINVDLFINSTDLVVDTANSRVGIGTASPDTTLQVVGDTKFGDDNTNYASFATDGELTLTGTARVIKCITFQGNDLSQGSQGPDHTILGNYEGLSYDIGDDSVFTFILPNDWASGTDISVLCRWYINEAYATASGEIQWQVDWSAVPADESEAVDSPTHSGSDDSGDLNIPATAKTLTEDNVITISGASLSAGDEIGLKFSRIAIDDGTNPTADPVVTCIGVIYTADKLGAST